MAPQSGSTEFSPAIMGTFKKAMALVEKVLADIKEAWTKLINAINSLLQKAHNHLNNDSVLSSIVEWATDTIKDAIEAIQGLLVKLRDGVNKIITMLQEVVSKSVPVLSLFNAGLAWPTKVNAPLSTIGNDMGGSGNTAYWQGPTKEVYEKEVKTQTDAVTASVDKVKFTSNWLADVATANTTYMTELGDRVAEVVGPMTALAGEVAATAAGAITQAMFAIDKMAETIAAAVTQALQYQINIAKRLAEVVKQVTALANEVSDRTGISDGNWPQSVVDA
ncbi:hypothetical protein ACFP2T_40350 [Plantactinospora solaniradicis]|uniref:WXG100 family type VII secretion target n=1 Tax=Plantactinospora solaniradicis TaxID=1723736 RepID=A0ABW1KLC3_9ACTN